MTVPRNKLNKAENVALQPAGCLLLHIHGVIAIVLSIFCNFVFYHGTLSGLCAFLFVTSSNQPRKTFYSQTQAPHFNRIISMLMVHLPLNPSIHCGTMYTNSQSHTWRNVSRSLRIKLAHCKTIIDICISSNYSEKLMESLKCIWFNMF